MPQRADPKSEAARLFGPLTLERKRAIRRRWYHEQVDKVLSPIVVNVEGSDSMDPKEFEQVMKLAAIRNRNDTRNRQVLERLERFARGDFEGTDIERRFDKLNARQKTTFAPWESSKWHSPRAYTTRYMQRRYAELLLQLPILNIKRKRDGGIDMSVTLSPFSLGRQEQIPEASEEDVYWAYEYKPRAS